MAGIFDTEQIISLQRIFQKHPEILSKFLSVLLLLKRRKKKQSIIQQLIMSSIWLKSKILAVMMETQIFPQKWKDSEFAYYGFLHPDPPILIELQPQGLQSHADQQPIERMAMKTFINCLNHHTFCKNINWNTLYYLLPTFFPIQLPGDKGLIKLIPLFDNFLLNILKMQWLIFLKNWHFTIIFGLLSEGWNCIITRHNPYGTFRS